MQNIIEIKNLNKSYEKEGNQIEVLKNLNWNAKENTFIAIKGESGCGKSTLFNLIAAIDNFNEGSIKSCGLKLKNLNKREEVLYKRHKIGLVFQNHNLIEELSVIDNIMLKGLIANLNEKIVKERARELLRYVNLERREKHYPRELSGGEAQRVALIRAIIHSPKLLLCDEPTGNLDEKNDLIVQELLIKLAKNLKTTLIVVSHNERFVKKADEVFVLKNKTLEKLIL